MTTSVVDRQIEPGRSGGVRTVARVGPGPGEVEYVVAMEVAGFVLEWPASE